MKGQVNSNKRKKMKLKIGDNVAYSVQFLRSICMSHSEMAHARGVITGIKKFGSRTELAEIEWKNADMPQKVNVKNLAKKGLNAKFSNI